MNTKEEIVKLKKAIGYKRQFHMVGKKKADQALYFAMEGYKLAQSEHDSDRHLNQDGWIRCSDKMPDVGVDVLIVRPKGHMEIAHCSNSCSWYDKHAYEWEATHWQPLPSPPKKQP